MTFALILIGVSSAATTVTTWLIGAIPFPCPCAVNGSIASWILPISSVVGLLKSLSKIVIFTVPRPFHIGVTFTAPTPSSSLTFLV